MPGSPFILTNGHAIHPRLLLLTDKDPCVRMWTYVHLLKVNHFELTATWHKLDDLMLPSHQEFMLEGKRPSLVGGRWVSTHSNRSVSASKESHPFESSSSFLEDRSDAKQPVLDPSSYRWDVSFFHTAPTSSDRASAVVKCRHRTVECSTHSASSAMCLVS